tara:strand:+ start:58623 stop:59483 length:861 start_codon:yes stop_codon:yes gene_type:complete
MKSTNLENKVLKGSILFLMITAVLMTTVLFTSCSDTTEEPLLEDDTSLISAIEAAATETVSISSLPSAARDELTENFSDDEVFKIQSAPNLGFQVDLVTVTGSWTSELNRVFFDTTGRSIEDRRRPRHGRRRSCFHLVFPFTVTMPDATTITLESKSDKSLIREWYVANPDVDERPTLVFPVEIEYQDGTTATIDDQTELEAARVDCVRVRCFDYVYPFSVTMPDASVIILNSSDDRSLVREWYRANPGVREKPELVYPIDIVYQDGTTQTINDGDELQAAKDNCQ